MSRHKVGHSEKPQVKINMIVKSGSHENNQGNKNKNKTKSKDTEEKNYFQLAIVLVT